jgi:hypothetical protein
VDDRLRASVEHFAEDLADSLGPIELACASRRRTHEPLCVRAQQIDEVLAKARAAPDAPAPAEAAPPAETALASAV